MAAALNTAEKLFYDSGRIADPKERQQLELLRYQVVEFAEMRLALRPARFRPLAPTPNPPSGRSGLIASRQRGKCRGVVTPAERTGKPYGCH
jgi:hypothetical protein